MTESSVLPASSVQLEMYRRMVRIRQFELAATDLFKRGQLKGTVHTYIGMEASGVGVCMALRDDDLIAGTHRSHGHNIAKGASLRLMMAELLGKETGYCKGRGGSMHIAAFETGSLGALAVVASGIPLAVGAGLGFKLRGEDRVAVPFTGTPGPTPATGTRASTWPRPGSCRSCSSWRTTTGASRRASRTSSRSPTSPSGRPATASPACAWTASTSWRCTRQPRPPWPAPAPVADRRSW